MLLVEETYTIKINAEDGITIYLRAYVEKDFYDGQYRWVIERRVDDPTNSQADLTNIEANVWHPYKKGPWKFDAYKVEEDGRSEMAIMAERVQPRYIKMGYITL